MGQWKFRDYIETIRVSVTFTRRYYLSFFLAILGVFVITVSLFLLILLIGALPLSVAFGPFDEIFDIFDSIGVALDRASDFEAVGIVLFVGSALLAPFLIALGTLFGMGQEIMESGSTSAEEVLLWYRQKFVRLAGGGVVQFLLIFSPIGVEYILGAWYFQGQTPNNTTFMLLIAIAFSWFIISSGMLSMVFPAIIDGMSITSSIKYSTRLARQNFGAVFSIWITFFSLGTLLLGPLILQEITDLIFLSGVTHTIYAVASILVTLLMLLPVYVLSTTRTYLLISDPNIKKEQVTQTQEGM